MLVTKPGILVSLCHMSKVLKSDNLFSSQDINVNRHTVFRVLKFIGLKSKIWFVSQ